MEKSTPAREHTATEREGWLMPGRFGRLLGLGDQVPPAEAQYDPVYGLPQRAIDEWLARNPRLRKRSPTRLTASKPVDNVAPVVTPLTSEKSGIP